MDAAFREDTEEDSRRWVLGLERARELAAACPDTRVISVCDREGDFWDLLAHAVDDGDALLVRASRSVQQSVRTPDGGKECLWEHVVARPPVAATELTIPAAGGPRARKERVARIEIRTAEIELLLPRWDRGAEPRPMFAVSAIETGTADGDDPLHWLLLTTERPAEGEEAAVHAATVLDWYRRRWTIETWFRTLKTGIRIKDRRLDSADDLRKCLAFDAVTAVHVADLTVLARERPETPATEVFPEEDIDLLHTMLESQGHRDVVRMPGGRAPDIRAIVIDLGRLVGSHPTPRQPLPGTKKVWQGLERMSWAVQVRDALGEKRRE
ncbi:MAG: IS4 family transposase [Rhodospirillales bacterium]|nr:IS4 family transposase [Rhodospirillales bacterium]